MRDIKYIVLHCTATSPQAKVESIVNYWKTVMKWKSPGYHFIISESGRITRLLSIDKISNGVAGFNSLSIHISYIGGIDGNGKAFDTRTIQQKLSQISLLEELMEQFPKAKVLGHRDFPGVKKECPSFDVKSWLESIGHAEWAAGKL